MNIAIIGAGMAGMGAAHLLQGKRDGRAISVDIFERETRPGGICKTERSGKFLFDYTGHLIHFKDPGFKRLVDGLLHDDFNTISRSAWIYSNNVFTRYPFQANLFGLPLDVIVECLYEYGKAYFDQDKPDIKNFEDWILAHFGSGIARHFMMPYNEKLYKRHPRDLAPDCAGRFVPESDLKLLLKGALTDAEPQLGYNATFLYPRTGGIETLSSALAHGLTGLHLNDPVVSVNPETKIIVTRSGKAVVYDALISTQPVTRLIGSIHGVPEPVVRAAERLTHVSVFNLNLGVKGMAGDRHWLYVPETKFPFYRIGFYHNFSTDLVPPGHGSLYIEVSYDPKTGIDSAATTEKIISDILAIGLIADRDSIVEKKVIDVPYGYVIHDHQRERSLKVINDYLLAQHIFSVGRFGSWGYTSMEDSFLQGKAAAEQILERCAS
jgi:protoporphyrinogen oxidase